MHICINKDLLFGMKIKKSRYIFAQMYDALHSLDMSSSSLDLTSPESERRKKKTREKNVSYFGVGRATWQSHIMCVFAVTCTSVESCIKMKNVPTQLEVETVQHRPYNGGKKYAFYFRKVCRRNSQNVTFIVFVVASSIFATHFRFENTVKFTYQPYFIGLKPLKCNKIKY